MDRRRGSLGGMLLRMRAMMALSGACSVFDSSGGMLFFFSFVSLVNVPQDSTGPYCSSVASNLSFFHESSVPP